MNVKHLITLVATITALYAGIAWSHGDHPEPHQMTSDMAKMVAAGTPGDIHAQWQAKVGTWDGEVTTYMAADAEPVVVTYTVERRLDMGGRVLEDRWSGDWMGQSFVGEGRMGYDNVTQRYWSFWTDNTSTGFSQEWGHYDEASAELVMAGNIPDPITGAMKTTKSVMTTPDADTEVITMYDLRGDDYVKTMAIKLTRR